jgi:signal transduction histidine kinase
MSIGGRPSAAGRAPGVRLAGGLTGRMLLASGLLLLVLGASFAVLLVAVADLRSSARTASDAEQVLAAANQLERLVVDLETGVRGFVITGRQQFLEPFDAARTSLPGRAATLERLSAGNPEQARTARRIAEAANDYVDRYAVPLVGAARRGDPAARGVAATAEGKRRVDAMRVEFDRFIATERQLAQARQERADGAARRAVLAVVGGLAVALLLVLGVTAYGVRAVVRPVVRAAQLAGRLAGGDLGARMPATGVAEVGQLERALNQMAGSLERQRDELAALAAEQAALRRVATLVAHGASPEEVFAAVAGEVGGLFGAAATAILRLEPDGDATVMGGQGFVDLRPGARFRPNPGTPLATVRDTAHAARLDVDDPTSAGQVGELRKRGLRSAVDIPIVVQGRLWGAIAVASRHEPVPPGTERRLAEFTELVATAIANAQAQADLKASRARVVASADQTRRRIERDLHDGAQQLLVSLALQLRAVQAAVPPELGELAAELDRVAAGLVGALDELREFARGIHPAILSEGGLGPALRTLARRSPVPVELRLGSEGRLPEPVEVAAYYVVSEALANAAKHARASSVTVAVEAADQVLRVSVGDDGVGGADLARGSGLVGLKDRVEALGGRLALHSEPGAGTSLAAELPFAGYAAAVASG